MKTVKKSLISFLSLTLTIAMLISMSAFGVSAGGSDLSNNLIIHYDFEEDNGGVLADKATNNGGVSDNLSMGDGHNLNGAYPATNFFVFENGTVRLKLDNWKVNLQTDTALNSADVKALQEGEATWFLRFSLADPTALNQLLDLRMVGNTRPFYLWYWNHALSGGYAKATAPNTNVNLFESNYTGLKGEKKFDQNDQWMNLAIVRTKSGDQYTINIYYCFGDAVSADSWFNYHAGTVTDSLAPMTDGSTWGSRLCLFQSSSVDTLLKASTGITYDDVRCYNTALSLEQISDFFKDGNNNFAKNVASPKTEFYGYQLKSPYTNGNGEQVFDVRLLATIDSTDYTSAGINFSTYESTLNWGDNPKGYQKEVTHCFSSILSNVDYKTVVTEAPDGKYFIAVTLTGIPVSVVEKANAGSRDCLRFAVTSYVIDSGGATSYGVTKFFTVEEADLGL